MLYWKICFGIFIIIDFEWISCAPDLCYLPDSFNKGHCVPMNDCSKVSLSSDLVQPDKFADFMKRSQNCKQIKPNTVCCEITQYAYERVELGSTIKEESTTAETIVSQEETTASSISKADIVSSVPSLLKNQNPENFVPQEHKNYRLFNDKKCGISLGKRVAGGTNAVIFAHPWIVRLGYLRHNEIEYKCGGSLISSNYVLTAAHCVTQLPSSSKLRHIRLGEYDTSRDIDCEDYEDDNMNCSEPVQDVDIVEAIPHPGYKINRNDRHITSIENDIALIRLKTPAKVGQKNIETICLPFEKSVPDPNRNYVIIGWGGTENSSKSIILREGYVPQIDRTECQSKLANLKSFNNIQLDNTHVCAGGFNKTDACGGDSGGPLLSPSQINNKPKLVQFGIVSFGIAICGSREFPGVYTNVHPYLKWIMDTVK